MKIITICGSLKYKEEMFKIAEEITLKGNCVLSVIYPVNQDISAYSKEDKKVFDAMHKERIKLSDAILVVDVNGYIGSSTQSEIEFAKSLNKEILYYRELMTN